MPCSSDTRALIMWLHDSGAFRGMCDLDELSAVLGTLGDCREVEVVPSLIPFVFHPESIVRRAAADALNCLLSTCGIDDFVWLERHVRVVSPRSGFGLPWRQIRKRGVRQQASDLGAFAAVCGLLSLHWNGHVREEAVRLLANSDEHLAVPFVLLRLNDWVPEVRSAATEVVQHLLASARLAPLALNLPLLTRLTGRVRAPHDELVGDLKQRLCSEDPPAALLAGCRSPQPRVRRDVLALALSCPGFPHEVILDEGLRSVDPVVRLSVVRRLAHDGEAPHDVDRLRQALDDPFMPVRREALHAIASLEPEVAGAVLEKAVLDRHPAIRYVARWHLSRHRERDYAARYREVLAEGRGRDLVFAALGGLGEVGTSTDLAVICPFLTHPTVRIRVVAVRAAARVAGDRDLRFLMQPLIDPSPKVSREAARALSGSVAAIGSAALWARFQEAERYHVRQNILHLLASLPFAERLIYLLRVAGSLNDPLANDALSAATTVLLRPNLGYVRLRAAEAEAIQRELEGVGSRLDDRARRHLRMLLAACSGA